MRALIAAPLGEVNVVEVVDSAFVTFDTAHPSLLVAHREGALLGARLTCGSDAIPVLLRPCSFIAPRAAMQHALLQRTPYWWMSSGARAARNQAVVQFFRQSAEPCADPPTSPFAALLMDPLAVRAQAHLPPCFSVSGCPISFSSAWRSSAAPVFFQEAHFACFPKSCKNAVSICF